MAQHDAATADHTDHDHGHGHGKDPGEDTRWIGLILAALGLGLALGIGRHVPGKASPAHDAHPSFEGVVVLADERGELRGKVELEDDLVRVRTGKSEVLLSRAQVHHIRRIDTSPRPTGQGIVVLTSGQVFVGALQQRPQGVVIDGLSFPKERVRWVEAGAETLSDAYWSQFPRAVLDPRYARERKDERSAAPAPTPAGEEPQRPRVVKDPFQGETPDRPSLRDEAMPATPGETKAERIKRLVDRARYRQLTLDWPAAAQTWRDAYLESGEANHRRDLERCLVNWATSSLGPEGWQGRYEMISEVVEPVQGEVRETLCAVYLSMFNANRSPERLDLIRQLNQSVQALGDFLDPDLRDGAEDLELFVETFSGPQQGGDFDFPGDDHDDHDH